MNRGRHKKNKKEQYHTTYNILDCIRIELEELYKIYKTRRTENIEINMYLAQILIINDSKEKSLYLTNIRLFIDSEYYINKIIVQVQGVLFNSTTSNDIYTIKCYFGLKKEIRFRYKKV